MKTEIDVIEDIEQYQTVPGVIVLFLRVIVMLCFLAALRDTMDHEHNEVKLQFFLHFGAASLVWFIYLPAIAFIALQVSKFWRTPLLTGITYSADTFGHVTLVHLLWPTRCKQYYVLERSNSNQDQFDEELDVLGQQINQLNDKEKVQRRLSRGEEKSNVNNNSKNFGMVKLQKADVPTTVLLDLTSSSEDEEDLMLKPP